MGGSAVRYAPALVRASATGAPPSIQRGAGWHRRLARYSAAGCVLRSKPSLLAFQPFPPAELTTRVADDGQLGGIDAAREAGAAALEGLHAKEGRSSPISGWTIGAAGELQPPSAA